MHKEMVLQNGFFMRRDRYKAVGIGENGEKKTAERLSGIPRESVKFDKKRRKKPAVLSSKNP